MPTCLQASCRSTEWNKGRRWGVIFPALVLAGIASCSEASAPIDLRPTSIEIAATAATITELDTLRFSAVILDQSGRPITTAKPSWVSESSVLSVDSTGLATALPTLLPFSVLVVARYAALADSVTLTVLPRIGSVEIVEGSGPLAILWPATLQLTTVVRNLEGTVLDVPPVTWTSTDSTRISVTALRRPFPAPGYDDRRVGVVRVVSLGRATVTATAGGKSARVTIDGELSPTVSAVVWPDTSVLPVSATRSLLVQQVGARVVLRGTQWESSDPSVATVDASGRVMAVSDGSAEISAILPDRRLSSRVIVYHYPAPLRFTAVTTGGNHTCALTSDGMAYCWGQNELGQLANDDVTDRCGIVGVNAHRCSEAPLPVNTNLRFASITAGGSMTCGLTASGTAYCWGGNVLGRTGTGLADPIVRTPTAVVGGLTFKTLDVGMDRTCGIIESHDAYCWGRGPLGNGLFDGSPVPVLVSGGFLWRMIRAGGFTSCGETTDSTAYCWGLNTDGQVGISRETIGCPTPISQILCVPTRVSPGLPLKFVQVESSDRTARTCGITGDRRGYCWGIVVPFSGARESTSVPTLVPGNFNFVTLRNRDRPCGVTAAGAVLCWGGIPYDPNPLASVPSFSVRDYVQGSGHSCARDIAGIYFCWDNFLTAPDPFVWASTDGSPIVASSTPAAVAGQR